MKTLVIAGASGFIGSHLIEHAAILGWNVKTIGRDRADATWNDQPSLMRVLEGADAVINLAGKSVNCRFTADNIEALIRSRVDTTQAIGDAIALCKQPPKTWINASGASIYPENVSEPNTEDSAIDGAGVMADVARQWENALYTMHLPATRRIALRITLVLGKDGGVFPIYKRLVSLGQGGAQGTGKQWVSWIHVTDLTRLLFFLLENDSISGPVNAAAPEPLPNQAFMATLRKAMKFPFGIPAPALLIRMGTAVIGADSELILRGMRVVSVKSPKHGFLFDYPTADAAFAALLLK
ncbi:MAG: TIGR01777 family oxidoreductase [Flavobacteriales bacterium]|jgi:uncharacterized protein (TIGR01777 family)